MREHRKANIAAVIVVLVAVILGVYIYIANSKQSRIPSSKGQVAGISQSEEPPTPSGDSVAGRWILRLPVDSPIITFRSDGTGEISKYPTTSFTWKSTGAGSFSAIAQRADLARKDFSGRLFSDGKQLLIDGWNPMAGTLGSKQTNPLDRVE